MSDPIMKAAGDLFGAFNDLHERQAEALRVKLASAEDRITAALATARRYAEKGNTVAEIELARLIIEDLTGEQPQ